MAVTGHRFYWFRRRTGHWAGPDQVGSYLTPGDPWAECVYQTLRANPDDLGLALQFLAHLPWSENAANTRWITATREALEDHPPLVELSREMVSAFVAMLETGPAPEWTRERELKVPEWRVQLYETGATFLIRGAVWALAVAAPPWAPELLVRAAQGGRGVASDWGNLHDIVTAAIRGLGVMKALDELASLQGRLTHRGMLKIADRVLGAACAAEGRDAEQVRETAVDSLGLDEGGRLRLGSGDLEAELQVRPTGVDLTWTYLGRGRASLPRTARESNPDLVAVVRTKAKRLREGVVAEKARLERIMVGGSTRPVGDWLQAYGAHPLTGPLAQALLWRVDGRLGLPGAEPGTFEGLEQVWEPGLLACVSLPHPLVMDEEELAAWRAVLVERRLEQPIAQVLRERYRAPEADVSSDTTNCMGGRVLVYRQFDALLRARGWRAPYRGDWDRGDVSFTAVRELNGIKATWSIEELNNEEQLLEFVRTGSLRLSVDRSPLLLRDAPVVALSEIMRDLDLVASKSDIALHGDWVVEGEQVLKRDAAGASSAS